MAGGTFTAHFHQTRLQGGAVVREINYAVPLSEGGIWEVGEVGEFGFVTQRQNQKIFQSIQIKL